MASIRRPRHKFVAPAIVGELYPLLAGNVHQIKIGRAGFPWTVLANPRERQELSIGRPGRGDRITLIGHTLLVGSVGFNSVNLRQAGGATHERNLPSSFTIPYWRNIRPPTPAPP